MKLGERIAAVASTLFLGSGAGWPQARPFWPLMGRVWRLNLLRVGLLLFFNEMISIKNHISPKWDLLLLSQHPTSCLLTSPGIPLTPAKHAHAYK